MESGDLGRYPYQDLLAPPVAPAPIYTQGVFEMADRLHKLKALETRLLLAIEEADERTLPGLAKQYRETIQEIEEIEGADNDGDEISEILAGRAADGKAGAVRKSRA